MQGTIVRCRLQSKMENERGAMFHVVKEKRRGHQKYIHKLITTENKQISTTTECLQEATNHFQEHFNEFPVSSETSKALLQNLNLHISIDDQQILKQRITEDELLKALLGTKSNTSPGNDGITYDFYKTFWNIL